ncbi:extracellular solute-binding protein [Gracilibacillus oryzae]|uniref:Extracellular solute-binding protein n=2 Tax=Gracilibacillus oryzae TaxID=1672701 RepID=A0A7C8GQD3_9BACI|nr:extracellular solute-binding protein [Gracilibacillus oryzae]
MLSIMSFETDKNKREIVADTNNDFTETITIREDLYGNYLSTYQDRNQPDVEMIVEAEDYERAEGMEAEVLNNFEGNEGKSLKTNETGSVHWEVEVEEEGMYNLAVKYFPMEGKSSSIERELWINGELPFQGAATLTFPRIWVNEKEEIERDNRGNDLRPRQIEQPIWQEVTLKDSEGYYVEPYLFYLKKGVNTISFVSSREPMVIDYLKIFKADSVRTYEEAKADYQKDGLQEVKDVALKIQGEEAILKSAPTLYAINDRSSPATEPYHVSKIRMNSIGGYNWRWPGQWITWEVDVPESGLYKIGIKNKQNLVRGVFSTRKLLINGEVPFKEVEKLEFTYHNDWTMKELGEGEEPYLFYLGKGRNEMTLEVTLGDIAPLLRTVEASVLELNNIYRRILMITGAVPDPYRDYQLEEQIPEMTEIFKRQSETLNQVADELEQVTGETSDQTAILQTMAYQLQDFVDRPETIKRRLDSFKVNVGSLGTWILTVREQPLEIDYLTISSKDSKLPKADASFFQELVHGGGAFFSSFVEDYNTIGNVADPEDMEEEKNITLWIGTGRDQAQVLKSMIDDTFTPQTGINVNLKLVQMDVLLPATLARQGPDVAMQIGNEIPVNYAMRNAVVDLTQFQDYEEIETRFRESAVVPYRYNEGVYALPEQQTFSMLFYRKDILEELDVEVPQTWDDIAELIPVLQKNHMDIAFPLLQDPQFPGQVQNLIPNQTFTMMLYQQDGKLYEEDATKSALDSEVSMDVFKDWTSLYTNYKIPLKFDFPNRFRTGEMPIGIDDYTLYNHLSVSAPEIRGLWEFVPVPGTMQEDGTIRREVGSSGTAAVIMEQSENKEAAWEFLKWWTSKDAQVRFGREMEGLMGAAARYPTANIEALKELPWPMKDYEQLEEQWQSVRGVPEVPGGYFTGRHLDNAFREVVNNGTNAREALHDYVIYINDEIRLKRKEFNLSIE